MDPIFDEKATQLAKSVLEILSKVNGQKEGNTTESVQQDLKMEDDYESYARTVHGYGSEQSYMPSYGGRQDEYGSFRQQGLGQSKNGEDYLSGGYPSRDDLKGAYGRESSFSQGRERFARLDHDSGSRGGRTPDDPRHSRNNPRADRGQWNEGASDQGQGSLDLGGERGASARGWGGGSANRGRGRGSVDRGRGRGSVDHGRGRGTVDRGRGRGSVDHGRGRGTGDRGRGRGSYQGRGGGQERGMGRGQQRGRGRGGSRDGNQDFSSDPYQKAGWDKSSSWRGGGVNKRGTQRGRGRGSGWSGPTPDGNPVQYNFKGKLEGPERYSKTFGEFKYCKICKVTVNSSITADSHYAGKPHLKKMKEALMKEALKTEKYGERCELCAIPYNSLEQAEAHISGARHKLKLEQTGQKPDTSEPVIKRVKTGEQTTSTTTFPCDMCGVSTLSLAMLASHLAGKKHKQKLQDLQLLAYGTRCTYCNIVYESPEKAQVHVNTDEHKKKVNAGVQTEGTPQKQQQNQQQNQQQDQQQNQQQEQPIKKRKWDVTPDQLATEKVAGKGLGATSSTKTPLSSNTRDTQKKDGFGLFRCELCKISTTSEELLQMHLQGKKHLRKLQQPPEDSSGPKIYFCQDCNVTVGSKAIFDNHLAGQRHQWKTGNVPPEDESKPFSCEICCIRVRTQEAMDSHLAGKRHIKNMTPVLDILEKGAPPTAQETLPVTDASIQIEPSGTDLPISMSTSLASGLPGDILNVDSNLPPDGDREVEKYQYYSGFVKGEPPPE